VSKPKYIDEFTINEEAVLAMTARLTVAIDRANGLLMEEGHTAEAMALVEGLKGLSQFLTEMVEQIQGLHEDLVNRGYKM